MAVLGKKQALSRRPRVVDINLLPREYRQGFRLSLPVLLVMLAVILLVPSFILNQWRMQAVDKVASLEVQAEARRNELSGWRNQDTQAAELRDQLVQIEAKLETIASDYEAFLQQKTTWHKALEAIRDFPGVSLSEVTNKPGSQQVTVRGVAPDATTVTSYGLHLKNAVDSYGSRLFSSVSSPSMTREGDSFSFSFILQARSGI